MTRHCARPIASSVFAFMLLLGCAQLSTAAPADRILRRVDIHRTRVLKGSAHPMARTEFDRGAISIRIRPWNR